MQAGSSAQIIDDAIDEIDEISTQSSDGKWLEYLTAKVAPHLKEWDVDQAWTWADWDEREEHFPETTNIDVGIDVVAKRRSDGRYIAIQCKSRQLDEDGRGSPIHKSEIDKFVTASIGDLWDERWIVTNGDVAVSDPTAQALSMHGKPVKAFNIAHDLLEQRTSYVVEDCPHCEVDAGPNSTPPPPPPSRNDPRPACRTRRSRKAFASCVNTNAPQPAARR